MKEAKLRAAQAVIEAFADTYRRNRHQMNAVEIALYEAALILSMKTLGPKESKAAIAKFETERAEQRARAEAARQARLAKSQQQNTTNAAC